MIKSGKTTIDPQAWKGKTKEEFFEVIRGKVDHDKEDLWKQVQTLNGDINESTGSTGAKSKKLDSKRTDQSTSGE